MLSFFKEIFKKDIIIEPEPEKTMISSEILTLKDSTGYFAYKPTEGLFFLYKKNAPEIFAARTCREDFGANFNSSHFFVGFYQKGLDILSLNNFSILIEKQLNFKPEERTVFYKTTIDGAVILKISKFWNETINNRSFLTLFMRCGAIFHKSGQDIQTSLKKYYLSYDILPAVNYFLEGHTINKLENDDEEFNGKSLGIHNLFENKGIKEIKEILFAPLRHLQLKQIWKY